MDVGTYICLIPIYEQMIWFEADKVTLSKIKSKYLFEAEDFLYFRKGEDWLKHLISFFVALVGGEDKILELSKCYSKECLEYAQTNIKNLIKLDKVKCLDWLLVMSGDVDETRMCYNYLKKELWQSFQNRWEQNRAITHNFQILCKKNIPDNQKHLPMWKAMETEVRFYQDDTEAGSHRFYLNEKGYAVFWRQGIDDKTRFCGFEGKNSEVIKCLKAIFEEEWSVATNT